MRGVAFIVVTVLLSTCCALRIRSFDEVGECKCSNDPHVTPFPQYYGAPQSTYLCEFNCTEVLVKNEFLEIFVKADPTLGEFPIIEYTVIFFATRDHPVPCVITDSIANPSPLSSLICPPGSPATTYGNYIHTTDDISVSIKYTGDWFNFYITQTFPLIAQSTGMCIQPDCKLESAAGRRKKRRDSSLHPIFSEIIEIYTNAGREYVRGNIDKNVIESGRIAAEHDLVTSFDARYARTIVGDILRASVANNENVENYVERLVEMEAIEREIARRADQEVNVLIETYGPVCKEDTDAKICLQPLVTEEGKKDGRRHRRK